MNNKIKQNEDGSALVTVIVFILVITLTISLILQFNRRQQITLTQKGLQLQVYHNAESFVHKLISEPGFEVKSGQTSLFGNDTTSYSIESWGLLIKIKVESKIKNNSSSRVFLLGGKETKTFSSALVLGNIQNPLILTGNTFIEGDVMVGMSGVQPGVLKGKRFQGNNAILGNVLRETRSKLPYFNPIHLDLKSQTQYIKAKDITPKGDKFYLQDEHYSLNQQKLIELQKLGVNSIIGPGLLEIEGHIVFENISLLNQIEIISDSSVTFSSNSRTEQVLVKANGILIENRSHHRGQFIAQNWLKAENTELKYPSVLAVINQARLSFKRFLQIGANTKIEGSVILCTETYKKDESEKIYIDVTAQINGFVYSNQFSEIYGEVRGTVMTQDFYLYSSPTAYINWLNGATISRPSFEGDFVIPVGLNISEPLIIVSEL